MSQGEMDEPTLTATNTGHTYSLRNVHDGQTVSIVGDGEFCIGLTLDETVACSIQHNVSARTKSSSFGGDDRCIAVPLMFLTVWKTSGVTVSPASRDLKCQLNGEDIETEAHLIPGSHIEVGDKVFELLEGTLARQPRRHLPPTPGVPLFPVPPPKPQRVSVKPAVCDYNENCGQHVLREWCLLQLPNSEHELLQQTKDPNQLANLASSYLTRHISVHTDVVMSKELTDCIFRMMQEVSHHRRDILQGFLSQVISEVRDEDKDSPDNTKHAKVTGLLVEILQQFLDPSYLVLLCLLLLRALSHIPGNVATMVASNTTVAVLGSMAAYKEDENIQNNCLDILAKLATFLPAVLEKPPLRESTIDLVTMAVTLHFKNLMVVQAGIRTLANLTSSLHLLAFTAMKDSSNTELQAYVTLVISVLDYLYNTTMPLVRAALGVFSTDLTVKTDGRRFLFEYAKMDQLKNQYKLWTYACDAVTRSMTTSDEFTHEGNKQPELEQNCEISKDCHGSSNGLHNIETDDNSTFGILKKSRSFENLRNPHRRVSFVHEDDLPQSSSSSVTSSPINSPCDSGQRSSPDIQVLSRSRIHPAALWSGDSMDGETSLCSLSGSREQEDSLCYQSGSVYRPVEAVSVHVGRQSDGETASGLDFSLDKICTHPPCFPNNRPHKLAVDDLDTTTNCESVTSDPELPLSSCGQHIPVDVTDFCYSAEDVICMKRLMSLQITCHICSASIQGLEPPALKLIDMPLSQLLSNPGIPNAVWQFANSQFDENARLMDVDPGTVISVIDAVRYRILTFDLVRKSLQMLIQNLTPKIHATIFEVTREVIESVFKDTALLAITADQEFITSLEYELNNMKQSFHDSGPVTSLIGTIRFLINHNYSSESIIKTDLS